MQLSFKSKKLQKQCNFEKEVLRTWGSQCGRKLMRGLVELKAADTLADISRFPPLRCHELSGERKSQFSMDLHHPYRLLFVPAHEPVPRLPDGGVDLEKVTEIEVLGVEDTH